MSIQGGGGGPRIPAPPGRPVARAPAPTTPRLGEPPSGSGPTQPDPTTPDSYRPPGGQSPLPPQPPDQPAASALLAVLEIARAQILEQHTELRAQAAVVVADLVRARFETSVREQRAGELTLLRRRLALLRRRLQHLQRRQKTLIQGRGGAVDIADDVLQRLTELARLEPGTQRSVLMLQTAQIALSSVTDAPAAALLRPPVGSLPSTGPLPTTLNAAVALSPTAAAAAAAAALLVRSDSQVAPAVAEGAATADLCAWKAFADAMSSTKPTT